MNKLAVNATPLLWRVPTPSRCLLGVQVRKITTLEAKRIMQIPDGSTQVYNEDFLKKQYLKLAKVYHPDAQGTVVSNLRALIRSKGKIPITARGLWTPEG